MSIVNPSGGDFSFGATTSIAGWVCAGSATNYEAGTCGNSHCPNNSGSQGAVFHQHIVCNSQIRVAITVEIPHGNRTRTVTHGVVHSGAECSVSVSQQNRHLIRDTQATRDRHVCLAIVVKVCPASQNGPGKTRTVERDSNWAIAGAPSLTA